jgi:hypothetical protein
MDILRYQTHNKENDMVKPAMIPSIALHIQHDEHIDFNKLPHAVISGKDTALKHDVMDTIKSNIGRHMPDAIITSYDGESAITEALASHCRAMNQEFEAMSASSVGKTISDRPHEFIIINDVDEVALDDSSVSHLCSLLRVGRAANMHVIITTKEDPSDVLNAESYANIGNRVILS